MGLVTHKSLVTQSMAIKSDSKYLIKEIIFDVMKDRHRHQVTTICTIPSQQWRETNKTLFWISVTEKDLISEKTPAIFCNIYLAKFPKEHVS